MVTLQQVADEIGMSVGTVSQVLNCSDRRYSPKTVERIHEAAKRLGYRPNRLAQGLLRGKTKSIGMVGLGLTAAMAMEKVEAIARLAQDMGYEMFLCGRRVSDDPELERSLIEGLLSRRVDGLVVLIEPDADTRYFRSLQQRGVPFVLIGNPPAIQGLPVVAVDIAKGAYMAMRHLIELGHRDIALALGAYTCKLRHGRVEGIKQALRESGLSVKPARMLRDGLDLFGCSYEFTRQQMSGKTKPTAIFYNNDELALAGLRALHEMGFEVPGDVSVVGYDDLPMAEFASPPLTTVRQPRGELAAAAMRILMEQIEGNAMTGSGSALLEPELIVRASTGIASTSENAAC